MASNLVACICERIADTVIDFDGTNELTILNVTGLTEDDFAFV